MLQQLQRWIIALFAMGTILHVLDVMEFCLEKNMMSVEFVVGMGSVVIKVAHSLHAVVVQEHHGVLGVKVPKHVTANLWYRLQSVPVGERTAKIQKVRWFLIVDIFV